MTFVIKKISLVFAYISDIVFWLRLLCEKIYIMVSVRVGRYRGKFIMINLFLKSTYLIKNYYICTFKKPNWIFCCYNILSIWSSRFYLSWPVDYLTRQIDLQFFLKIFNLFASIFFLAFIMRRRRMGVQQMWNKCLEISFSS